LTPAAREIIFSHSWPGNVRELFAALSAARRRTSAAVIDVNDLPAPLRLRQAAGTTPAAERALPLDTLLEQTERRLIELALRRAKGHRGRAAEILGIWRARLLRRLEALGLDQAAGKERED
jgi:DNA-binding NtrC family response regulator